MGRLSLTGSVSNSSPMKLINANNHCNYTGFSESEMYKKQVRDRTGVAQHF